MRKKDFCDDDTILGKNEKRLLGMTEQDFIKKMVDIMDTEDEITMDSVLEEIEEWDSLSYVGFLSLCASTAKTKVHAPEVRAAKTVRDLYHRILCDRRYC